MNDDKDPFYGYRCKDRNGEVIKCGDMVNFIMNGIEKISWTKYTTPDGHKVNRLQIGCGWFLTPTTAKWCEIINSKGKKEVKS